MRNPISKRLLRNLKDDFGKYIAIFLFMTMLISLVSGFLVADNSIINAYQDGFTKYNIEDGHIAFNKKPEADFLKSLSERAKLTFYELDYLEREMEETGSNTRIYKLRDTVNLECVMDGSLPTNSDEIAIDRMYAANNRLNTGDYITFKGRKYKISGLVALPDYSCLFEANSDIMFDSMNFCVGVMTEDGFNSVESSHYVYNYAWKYAKEPIDDIEAKEMSDDFLDILEEELTEYDSAIIKSQFERKMAEMVSFENVDLMQEIDEEELLSIEDYLPRYLNRAINFTGEDMGSDKALFVVLDYIVIVILAFIFGVTTLNTITNEAGVIGTLRASGYTKGELIRHYMALPIFVSLAASIVGNVLGYTLLKNVMVGFYYDSYSLCTYETLWNMEAFVDTTVVPMILMLVINFFIIASKLKLSPLRFLRRDISNKGKKKAIRLNTKLPFMSRYRIRVILQNIPAYVTLFAGIFFAGFLSVFGFMFQPLFEDYGKLVLETKIASYQYILTEAEETENKAAEKYCVEALETMDVGHMIDSVSIYGIEKESKYIKEPIEKGRVLINNGLASKYGYKEGDTVTFKAPYSSKTYSFEVGGVYTYDAALSVFMNRDEFNELFSKNEDYYTGYFSNEALTDLNEKNVYYVVTEKDLMKLTNQLVHSLGSFAGIIKYFASAMFILLMMILTKLIIEKNTVSIAMVKILGFTEAEIGRMYLVSTSLVVCLSLFIMVPVINFGMQIVFDKVLYRMISGYIPFIISGGCYTKTILMGIACYIVSCVFLMIKINRIPRADALKMVE